MGSYCRESSVVEAFRWTGDKDQTEDPVWVKRFLRSGRLTFEGEYAYVNFEEGGARLQVRRGGYIILVNGGNITAMAEGDFLREFISVNHFPSNSIIVSLTEDGVAVVKSRLGKEEAMRLLKETVEVYGT